MKVVAENAMNKGVGRPRSLAADEAILLAAQKMLYKKPYQDVTMEAIAQEAGVSKATLYRRWPNKAVLAVEVLVQVVLSERKAFGQKAYRDHLVANLHALREMLSSDYADVIASVIAEAQHDRALRQLFFTQFLQPVQAIGDADVDLAIDRGEVKPGVDKDLLFDQIFGLFYYRLLIAHKPITTEDIEKLVDAFLVVAGTG